VSIEIRDVYVTGPSVRKVRDERYRDMYVDGVFIQRLLAPTAIHVERLQRADEALAVAKNALAAIRRVGAMREAAEAANAAMDHAEQALQRIREIEEQG
jgi:hypothetical protein